MNDVLGQMLTTFPETNGWGYGQFTYDQATATSAPEKTDPAFGKEFARVPDHCTGKGFHFHGISCAVSGAMGESWIKGLFRR